MIPAMPITMVLVINPYSPSASGARSGYDEGGSRDKMN